MCYNFSMDIAIMVIGIILVVMLAYIIYSGRKPREMRDYKSLEERLIRMEAEISRVNPEIDRNFRENRREIAENLDRL